MSTESREYDRLPDHDECLPSYIHPLEWGKPQVDPEIQRQVDLINLRRPFTQKVEAKEEEFRDVELLVSKDTLPYEFGRGTLAPDIERQINFINSNYPITEEVEAEGEELYCNCLKKEDGRIMIECSNGRFCRIGWYQ